MLKAGYIGLGRMGLTHYSILNTNPAVKNTAVCDQSRLLVNLFKKYVDDVAVFRDYQTMIKKSDLDLVIVSTPTDSHADIIQFALENGLHVFVEKPFVLDPRQGEEIVRLCENRSLVNQVGYVNRFNDVFREVKTLLEANVIGRIKFFKSEMFGGTVLRDSKGSWRGKKELGGGCMFDFASHCIDSAVYLIGEPDNIAGSVMQSIFSSNVEDLVSSTFIYKSGVTGNLLVNWSDSSYRKPSIRFEILGTGGKIIVDQFSYRAYLDEADEARGLTKGWNTRYLTELFKGVRFYLRGTDFTNQLDYFIDRVQSKDSSNINSFAEALKTDIIMEKIMTDFQQRS